MTTEPISPRVEDRSDRAFPFDRRNLTLRFRASFPSSRDAIHDGVEEVIRQAESAGCLGAGAADVEIALREALANAVIHGNGLRPDRRVRVRCYGARGEGILVVVRDEGEGFNPDAVPDPRDGMRRELPHGRGIFLMRVLMDRAEHRKGGREVLLFKLFRSRTPGPGRPARKVPR